jgi:hypothetical protein
MLINAEMATTAKMNQSINNILRSDGFYWWV